MASSEGVYKGDDLRWNAMDEGEVRVPGVNGEDVWRQVGVDDSSDESATEVCFNDSEEDRDLCFDDGFQEVPQPHLHHAAGSKIVERFVPPNMEAMHEIEDNYDSDELDSDLDSGSDVGDEPKYPKYKEEDMCKTFKFRLGMEFVSLKQFKEAVLEHSVLNGREVKFVKNDAFRVRVKCKQKCDYKVLVSRVGHSHTYRVKTLISKHNCGRVFSNKNAKSKWVSKMLVDKLKSNSKMTLSEIIDDMRITFSAGITMSRAFKARKLAREVVQGDASKQYTLLWSYSEELRRICSGNTCKLNLDRPTPTMEPRFGRFYMCLDGCKRAFKAACRPFIGVDGCHLKNQYGGQLLIAVGRDPNDQYLPLAFAVVETETKESWRWFLTLLLEDIGDHSTNRWVFISDQQKGLIPTFEEMLEGSEHRFCLRHLYNNMKKKFGRGTLIRDLMMGAAKATYYEAWEEKMLQLKEVDQKAYDWLAVVPRKCWCKHAFSYYPRCDVLMNNLSESFNSTILLARDKPIITMFEWIRRYLMERFATLKEKLSKYQGDVMPRPRKRLDKEVQLSGNWFATWAGSSKFEVTHMVFTDRFIVNLETHSCTCNFWDLVGIPCRHAVAAITFKGDNPELYVHRYYKRELYELCYNHDISAINGQNKWPKTDDEIIVPPNYKRGSGRPKKLRRRESDEIPSTTKLRTHSTNRCNQCHTLGHNSRTCQNTPSPSNAKSGSIVKGKHPFKVKMSTASKPLARNSKIMPQAVVVSCDEPAVAANVEPALEANIGEIMQ